MKDVYIVLRQKEKDLARVRKEIQSLLIAIPLLAEDESPNEIMQLLLDSSEDLKNRNQNMAQLEVYYPFIRNLRAQGRLG